MNDTYNIGEGAGCQKGTVLIRRPRYSSAAPLSINGDLNVSVKAIVQKILSLFHYRLVRIARKSELGLDIVDRKQKINGYETAKSEPQGDLEIWFRRSRPLKIDKWLHYFSIYERHFASFKEKVR